MYYKFLMKSYITWLSNHLLQHQCPSKLVLFNTHYTQTVPNDLDKHVHEENNISFTVYSYCFHVNCILHWPKQDKAEDFWCITSLLETKSHQTFQLTYNLQWSRLQDVNLTTFIKIF
jgi:hypothetical protein